MALIWSIPEALITSELASAFPEASGGVAWVEEAFGPAWAWIAGKNGWISGVTDSAIYPVLLLNYFLGFFQHSFNKLIRWLLLTAISSLLAYVNWLGLRIVGRITIIVGIATLIPFLVMSVIGAFQVDPNRWFILPDEEYADQHRDVYDGLFPKLVFGNIIWRPFLNNLFW